MGVVHDFTSKSTSELSIRKTIQYLCGNHMRNTTSRTLPAGRSAACSFHTTSAVLYFSTMKTCNGTLLASGQLVTSQVQCTCLRKNNTTQTLLTTHEVQTANKTLIQIQHAKCRIHSANVSTSNAVTMSCGPSFHHVFHIATPLPVRLSHTE